MAGVMDTLISGIVKSAMSEILKKTGVKPSTTTKRTKRKTRSTSSSPSTTSTRTGKRKPTASGGGSSAAGAGRAPARKQVSKRRTNAARSKTRRRG